MLTAEAVHARIEQEAVKTVSPEIRVIEKVVVGGKTLLSCGKFVGPCFRQGDIYLHLVPDTHTHGELLKSSQLAEGSSQGSRHAAESPAQCYAGTTLPEWCAEKTFLGPLIRSSERFMLTHPPGGHAHCSVPPGTYQVTHQMDAMTLKRVQD